MEVDGRLDSLIDDERIGVEGDQRWREHRPHELPHGGAQRAVAAGQGVAELSRHPFCAERLGVGDTGGIECECGAEPGDQPRNPAEWVGVSKCALELGVGDRVRLAWFVAAGVADGLLAFGVSPAGAVGDQLAVMADEEPADDLGERAELGVRGVDQAGADVVPEAKVAAGGVSAASAGLRSSLFVFGGRVAELVVIEAGTCEVGILAGRRRVALPQQLVDEIEHEGGVDDPDPGGEVLPAVVDVGVATVAGSVAHVAGDADLQRPGLCPGGEGVELCVEAVERAAENVRDLALTLGVEVLALVGSPARVTSNSYSLADSSTGRSATRSSRERTSIVIGPARMIRADRRAWERRSTAAIRARSSG